MNIEHVLRGIADTLGMSLGKSLINGVQPSCALDAVRIIGDLEYERIQMPEFIWNNNGGLQIEWHTERGQIKVYINPGAATLLWIVENGGEELNFSLTQLYDAGTLDQSSIPALQGYLNAWIRIRSDHTHLAWDAIELFGNVEKLNEYCLRIAPEPAS